MSPFTLELSTLEVEPLHIVENAPRREGFYTPEQESSLESLTMLSDVEEASLLTGKGAFITNSSFCCCCCCPICCCV